jgi:hypothetical protein
MTTLHVSKLETPKARRTLTLAVRTVALVLAAFTLPISARAADVAGSKETIVRAIFERVDGCVLTTLEVLVVDERVRASWWTGHGSADRGRYRATRRVQS